MRNPPLKNSTVFPERPDFSITFLSQTQLLKMVVDLTRHITTLSNFSTTDAQKISLAIDEAVTNVIKHSYLNKSDKDITIEYFLTSEGIKIRIVYAGIPPEPQMKRSTSEHDQEKKEKRSGCQNHENNHGLGRI